METVDRNIIDAETQQTAKTRPIETQTSVNEPSSVQEDVTQLESVITKTIENNNENAKEVERELEKIVHERKEATEKVILTDASFGSDDFMPIVETFSEDDAIVIKPKPANIEDRQSEAHEQDYVIEDNTLKGGHRATVTFDTDETKHKTTAPVAIVTSNVDAERAKLKNAYNHNEAFDASNEFDDDSKDIDDVTISIDGAKVRLSFFIQTVHSKIKCVDSSIILFDEHKTNTRNFFYHFLLTNFSFLFTLAFS